MSHAIRPAASSAGFAGATDFSGGGSEGGRSPLRQCRSAPTSGRSSDRLGADRHRPGVRVRLLGDAGREGAPRGGLRGRAGQLQSRHHHDRPGDGPPHLRRAAHARVRGAGHRARAAGRAPAHGGRPDRPQPRGGARRGRHARPLRRRADRRQAPRHQDRGGPEPLRRRHGAHRPRDAARLLRPSPERGARGHAAAADAVPADHPPVLHARRHRRLHRLPPGGAGGRRQVGAPAEPGPAGARRGVGDRLEGVRARGDARPRRQRRHHLLDRELRPDGRAHRRLHHGGARADA